MATCLLRVDADTTSAAIQAAREAADSPSAVDDYRVAMLDAMAARDDPSRPLARRVHRRAPRRGGSRTRRARTDPVRSAHARHAPRTDREQAMNAVRAHCPACATILAGDLPDGVPQLIATAETAGWIVEGDAHHAGRIRLTLGRPAPTEPGHIPDSPYIDSFGLTFTRGTDGAWRLRSAWHRARHTNNGETDHDLVWGNVAWLTGLVAAFPAAQAVAPADRHKADA